jgi:hypothetical protein
MTNVFIATCRTRTASGQFGNVEKAAIERNKNAPARAEAKARELVLRGRAHELKLQVRAVRFAHAAY